MSNEERDYPHKENDKTMSVGSEEEELQINYNPSFEAVLRDDDDSSSSAPPPPPPMLFGAGVPSSIRDIKESIFRSRSKLNNTNTNQRVDVEEGDASPPVEIVASKEECDSTIEAEAAETWMKSFNMKESQTANRKRRVIIIGGIFLFLLLILGLAIGLSNNNDSTKGSDELGVNGAPSAAPGSTDPPIVIDVPVTTDAPEFSDAPSAAAPLATDAPVVASPVTPSPTTAGVVTTTPPTTSTTQPPVDTCFVVTSPRGCYQPSQEIIIDFQNCAPEVFDWIGIWSVVSVTDPNSLPDPAEWILTCGTKDCTNTVNQGSVFISQGIATEGTYVAGMLRQLEEVAPFTSTIAASSTFDVLTSCVV